MLNKKRLPKNNKNNTKLKVIYNNKNWPIQLNNFQHLNNKFKKKCKQLLN